MWQESEASCSGVGSFPTRNSALNAAQNLQSYLEDASDGNDASGFMANLEEPKSLKGMSSALAFNSKNSPKNNGKQTASFVEEVNVSKHDEINSSSAYQWTLPGSHTASRDHQDFCTPSTQKKPSRPQRHIPTFLGRTSGPASSNKEQVRIQSDVLDLSLDEFGTGSRQKAAPVSSVDSEGSNRKKVLDPGTARKLREFSLKLKALKAPATRKLDFHENRGNESGRLNSSRRSMSSRNTSINLPEPDLIVSLVEGRGTAKGEVGIAAFQISNPVLILCQLSDSPTYPRSLSKLMSLNPVEIIMPADTIFARKTDGSGESRCKLSKEVNKFLPGTTIHRVQRKHFDDKKGLSLLQTLGSTESGTSVELHYQNKYYALAATAALIQYLQFSEGIRFHAYSLRVVYESAQLCTTIDPLTAEHIELITSIGDQKSKFSLFGCLNKCTTRGGTRLLRSNLFQPPSDQQMTEDRLEAVSELVENPQLHQVLKNALPRFQDIELILSLCVQLPDQSSKSPIWLEKKMDKVICLKGILEYMEPLSNLLADVKSKILSAARELMTKHAPDCSLLLEMMDLVINKNCYHQQKKGASNLKFARSMVVKENVNPLLDMDRAAMCENIDDLETHTKELEDEYNIPVRLMYSANKGFYLSVTKERGKKLDDNIPKYFQRVQKNKNGFTFTTEEITLISDTILEEVLSEVREYIWFLYQVSETISHLDVITALATVSCGSDYVKPEFGSSMIVRAARHPILETIQPEVVPNDIVADIDNRMVILTGPNMSGKSTYLRKVVLICIMAQIGCFVPASQAVIRIPDRIFSRVSNRDSIETNSSTFMLEMKEVAHMIEGRSDLSLIIIDELGRGTSVEEGSGVCWAVCEELLRGEAFVFLATHFQLIPQLARLYPTVSNYHFLSSVDGQEESFAHMLVKGTKEPGPKDNYGIELAASTNLDRNVIEMARQFLPRVNLTQAVISPRDRVDESCINLLRSIRQMCRLGLTRSQLIQNLRLLREDFLRQTRQIRDQDESD